MTELPQVRLSVVEAEEEPDAASLAGTGGDMILIALAGERGFRYRALWRSAAGPGRVDLEKLCLPLNSLEPNARGRWRAGARGEAEGLRFTDDEGRPEESGLRPDEVVPRVAWFLAERGQGALSRAAGKLQEDRSA